MDAVRGSSLRELRELQVQTPREKTNAWRKRAMFEEATMQD